MQQGLRWQGGGSSNSSGSISRPRRCRPQRLGSSSAPGARQLPRQVSGRPRGLQARAAPGAAGSLQWPDEEESAQQQAFSFGGPGSEPAPVEREREPPKLVRVRLSVHYRVHSRQMLCIGGSQMPFGWSFLSIAKVPMTWTPGDVWEAEVMLPAGSRTEYKFTILEEQDWTKLENEDAEGLVEVNYRSGSEPGRPPDVQIIQKQMAIVAWQPGPNRMVQVPTEDELRKLRPGESIRREPARPPSRPSTDPLPQPDPYEGTSETLTTGEGGEPLLLRTDVWGYAPPAGGRPAAMRNLRLDVD